MLPKKGTAYADPIIASLILSSNFSHRSWR